MANSPIGVTFIPNEENQAMGPRQASIEGGSGSTDLAQAFKVLSLHLPQVLGAGALSPRNLLASPGASGIPTGGITAPDASGGGGLSDPNAAAFMSLIKAMLGGSFNFGGVNGALGAPAPSPNAASSGAPSGGSPTPRIEYGKPPDIYGGSDGTPAAAPQPSTPSPASPTAWTGGGGGADTGRERASDRYL